MDLYEKRDRTGLLTTEFLPQLEAGDIGVLATAIYIEERYLPDQALPVALGQIARIYAEADSTDRVVIGRDGSGPGKSQCSGRVCFQ